MILEGNYAMNRQKLVSQIRRYVPYNEQEEADKALILNWIEKNDDAFLRDNVVAHMTLRPGWWIRTGVKSLWCITIFIIPGHGLAGMRMGRQIFWRLQSGR